MRGEVTFKDSRQLVVAPPEVLDEFARVSERFQTEFDLDVAPETSIIDTYFDERGLQRHPTITVPYTAEGFAAATAVASETKFPIPFVLENFSPETDFGVVARPGTAFCVPAYKLNVVTDTSEQCSLLYGEVFTRRILSNIRAHEIAHSVFHANKEIVVEDGDRRPPQTIYEVYPLSGMRHPVYSATGKYSYVPMWTEEAFAVYVSGDVFKDDIPDGPGHITQFDPWGAGTFRLDEHYLVRVSEYPDDPGTISGAVAGQTLEILDQRIPGTIDAMFGIARGETDPKAFREDLKRKIGPQLFRLMFTNQPHTVWASIYSNVYSIGMSEGIDI
jgi:hypothetical protein